MKFLILAALVAVAAAEYHDDTFHFSTLGSSSGLKSYKQYDAAPAYRQQYAASPVVYQYQQEQPEYKQVEQYHAAPVEQYYHAAPEQYYRAAPQQYYRAAPAVEHYAAPAYEQQYAAAPAYEQYSSKPFARILSHVQEADASGPYRVAYSTENGIKAEEQGSLINSPEGPAVAAQGSYSYTGDDNQVYTVNYVADENGFRAAGDHLPTPPPIPAEILKSLEENARSGEQYDDQGKLIRSRN